MIRSLWHSRNLLFNLVRRDLTVRYKSTLLGFFWSFLKPLALTGIYMLVFGMILRFETPEPRIPSYALYVLVGILPWTFFASATSEAMHSILASANLIKKVKLPLQVFPVAAVCAQAVHFALAMVVVVGVMLAYRLFPGLPFLLLPLVAALQFTLVLAVALLLSSLNVFYRDVASLWEVLSTAWFYLTPIIYTADVAMDHFAREGWSWAAKLYLLNPMTPIILAYRRLLLYGAVDTSAPGALPLHTEITDRALLGSTALALALSLGLLFVSYSIFQRLSRRFADEL